MKFMREFHSATLDVIILIIMVLSLQGILDFG